LGLSNRRCLIADLLELTILAASAIEEFNGLLSFFTLCLTADAASNPGHGPAARFRDFNLAVLTMRQAFAIRHSAFGQFDRGFHRGLYLFVYRLIAGPTNGHHVFLLFQCSRDAAFFAPVQLIVGRRIDM
jgi:hypothetical protein